MRYRRIFKRDSKKRLFYYGDRLILINNCPVCNGSDFETFLSGKDFFLSGESFNIVSCLSCRFKLTNPIPKTDLLSNYYESDEYISHSHSKTGLQNRIYHLVRKYAIQSKIRMIKRYKSNGVLLDIGCGTGEFLKEIRKSAFSTMGIEPNLKARTVAEELNKLTVFDKIEKLPEGTKFDVITLWHVLEHINDLNIILYQIKNLLNRDGLLIIAVPNSGSFDAKYYKEFWAAYDLPRHLYHFDKNSMELLVRKLDFEIAKVKPMIFDAFYVSLLSEKYKTGKSNYFKAFFIGLLSNFRAMLDRDNYSSLIFILKTKKT